MVALEVAALRPLVCGTVSDGAPERTLAEAMKAILGSAPSPAGGPWTHTLVLHDPDDTEGIDGTPAWAYDSDGCCVCCENGRRMHHDPDCELRDALDALYDDIADGGGWGDFLGAGPLS